MNQGLRVQSPRAVLPQRRFLLRLPVPLTAEPEGRLQGAPRSKAAAQLCGSNKAQAVPLVLLFHVALFKNIRTWSRPLPRTKRYSSSQKKNTRFCSV